MMTTRHMAKRALLSTTATRSIASAVAATWSGTLSYASPESDFAGRSMTSGSLPHTSSRKTPAWSGLLSFTSPESDFVGERAGDLNSSTSRPPFHHDESMLHAPETALGVIHSNEMLPSTSSSSSAATRRDFFDMQSLLLLANAPDTATGSVSVLELLNDKLKAQVLEWQDAKDSLPLTMEAALEDERPIVITSAKSPFQVVDVNPAWEHMCGYQRKEAVGANLQDLLQGPETETDVATDLVRQLRRQAFAQASLTNYTKEGRKFRNRVSVGVLTAAKDDGEERFFVGVLDDLDRMLAEASASKKSASSM